MRAGTLLAALALAGCATTTLREPAAVPAEPALYGGLPAGDTAYANSSLARLFATLTLETEWGGAQARVLRLEAPVRVALSGRGSANYRGFLDNYLAYLRRHTGIDIGPGTPANLHLRLVEGTGFETLLPAASCVLVPGDIAWDAFRRAPSRLGGTAMVEARGLSAVTVFVPDTAIPGDIRRCLLEEIAQSLGPRNDLYGLGASIFNDDFGHLWPTRLDLLMLRVLYAPEIAGARGRAETEAAAHRALGRLNPEGRAAPPLPDPKAMIPAGWRRLIARATERGPASRRIRAAEDALALARTAPAASPARCHSLITLATLLRRPEPLRSERLFAEAERACTAIHGPSDPRLATLRLARAGLALSRGEATRALELTDGLDRRLAAHGLDEALASHYAIRQRALDALGRGADADRARALAAAWGAYAFGRADRPD